VWVAWTLKGAAGTPRAWARLSNFDREVIVAEVERRIEEHNEAFDE
jgi:hypothetical protein